MIWIVEKCLTVSYWLWFFVMGLVVIGWLTWQKYQNEKEAEILRLMRKWRVREK